MPYGLVQHSHVGTVKFPLKAFFNYESNLETEDGRHRKEEKPLHVGLNS